MQARSAYLVLTVAGTAGTLILAIALAGAVASELTQSHSGLKAPIAGVYRFDQNTGQAAGSSGREFSQSDDLAGEVDWSTLPAATQVSAEWYDASGALIDSSGPGPASSLPARTVMRADDNSGAGWYAFEVERWSDGQRVETLARVVVDLQ